MQIVHDCMDAGVRAMQEQLPRSNYLSMQSTNNGINHLPFVFMPLGY